MHIDRLETFELAPRWLVVRLETSDGVVGWGESTLEGRAGAVAATIDELRDLIVGAPALRREDLWQTLTRSGFYRGGPVLSSAVAGIDQAMWDIAGKVAGMPVYDLLGGAVRDRVRTYRWIGGDEPGMLADAARAATGSGASALKMNASGMLAPIDTPGALALIAERVGIVRDAVGPDVDIALDFHGRFTVPMARRALSSVAGSHPMFVEEPVVPELSHMLSRICASTDIPIATGERLYSRWDFRAVIDSGVAVVQPDVAHAGGISEVRRISAAAETHGILVAPHCPLGPVGLAASIQLDAATPNFLIQEHALDIHYNGSRTGAEYVMDIAPLVPDSGYLTLPKSPGLGIDMDERAVRALAERQQWRAPVWRQEDGTLAEW